MHKTAKQHVGQLSTDRKIFERGRWRITAAGEEQTLISYTHLGRSESDVLSEEKWKFKQHRYI